MIFGSSPGPRSYCCLQRNTWEKTQEKEAPFCDSERLRGKASKDERKGDRHFPKDLGTCGNRGPVV